jgi:hypothetical protein
MNNDDLWRKAKQEAVKMYAVGDGVWSYEDCLMECYTFLFFEELERPDRELPIDDWFDLDGVDDDYAK